MGAVLRQIEGGMITRDEWLAALGEADTPIDPDAVTVSEFGALLGVGRMAASAKLVALVKNGKAAKVHKVITCGDGRRIRVSAYRLVKKVPRR